MIKLLTLFPAFTAGCLLSTGCTPPTPSAGPQPLFTPSHEPATVPATEPAKKPATRSAGGVPSGAPTLAENRAIANPLVFGPPLPSPQTAAAPRRDEASELVARLDEMPVTGASFGGPYRAIEGNALTRQIIAGGKPAVPTLIAGLSKSNWAGSVYIVYCLRQLRAAEATDAVSTLKDDLQSGRRTFGEKHDFTLDVQIDFFLRASREW